MKIAKLIPVLVNFGILPEDVDHIKKMDFAQVLAFHMDEPPRRVDFLTKIVGLTYSEADAKRYSCHLVNFRFPYFTWIT